MAALTLDALLRSLKKRPADPVYLLSGDEDVLKNEAVQAIVAATVEPAARDFNLDTRWASSIDAEAFDTLVNTLPLLAERRAVVIRGIEALGKRKSKLRDAVLRYVAAPNPATVLILITSAGDEPDTEIARRATAVGLEPLEPARIPRWIAHYAGTLEIDPDAVELLIAHAGPDLGALAREIDKLAAAVGMERRPVSAADVTALVGVRRGETVHDLVAAALERRAADAARLAGAVLEQGGTTGVKIVTLIGTHLIGTALARAERERGAGGARLEAMLEQQLRVVRPYGLGRYREEAARWSRWSELWTAGELARALRAALAADVALKTSTVTDDKGIVLQLVLGFAAVKREAA